MNIKNETSSQQNKRVQTRKGHWRHLMDVIIFQDPAAKTERQS